MIDGIRIVALAVLLSACHPKPGASCKEEGKTTCADDKTQLACENGAWVAFPCRGTAGCKKAEVYASCDLSGNAPDDPCPKRDEGRNVCTPKGDAMLECRAGKIASKPCPGPHHCETTDKGLRCDLGEPEIGTPCDPDNVPYDSCTFDQKALIVCVDGRWKAGRSCRGKRGCVNAMNGEADCDLTGADEGDPCEDLDDGRSTCTTDGKGTLTCNKGRWTQLALCANGKECRTDGVTLDQVRWEDRRRFKLIIPRDATCR